MEKIKLRVDDIEFEYSPDRGYLCIYEYGAFDLIDRQIVLNKKEIDELKAFLKDIME